MSLSTSRTCTARLVPTPISKPWLSARKHSLGQLQVRLSHLSSLSPPLISPSSSRQGACPQGPSHLANVRHRRHLIRLLETRSRRCRDPEADKDEQYLHPRVDRFKSSPLRKMKSLLTLYTCILYFLYLYMSRAESFHPNFVEFRFHR